MSIRSSFVREGAFWLGALDVLCLVSAVPTGIMSRRLFGPVLGLEPLDPTFLVYVRGHFDGWFFFCASIVVANYVVGNYDMRSAIYRFNVFVNWLFSLVAGLLFLSATSYAWFEMLLGRGVLVFTVAAYALYSLLAKSMAYGLLLRSNLFLCRTVLLGIGERARSIRRMIEGGHVIPRHAVCGYVVVPGAGSEPDAAAAVGTGGVAVVRTTVEHLEDGVRGLAPDLIIMCSGSRDEMVQCFPALRRLRFSGIEVLDSLSATEFYGGRVPLDLVDEAWMMQATMAPSMAVVRRVKRVFDIVVACLAAVILVPVGALVALLIKLTAPRSPVFYAQDRVGQFGRIFRMYKFRTMVENAEAEGGPMWSPKSDPRVTRFGRLLRRFRLDEIPQLWNVFLGEMSLVGPRPERPEIVAELQKRIPNYRERENAPPGLTGWAQVRFPYVDTVEDVSRKLEFDLYYIKNLSVRLDIQILLRTVRIVVFGKERAV